MHFFYSSRLLAANVHIANWLELCIFWLACSSYPAYNFTHVSWSNVGNFITSKCRIYKAAEVINECSLTTLMPGVGASCSTHDVIDVRQGWVTI